MKSLKLKKVCFKICFILFIIASLITFKVRDAWTFLGVNDYNVIVRGPDGSVSSYKYNVPIFRFQTDKKGKYEFEFYADGYYPLKTHFVINDSANLNVDILLSRKSFKLDEIRLMPDEALIEGYVSDNSSLKPLSKVKIKVGNLTTFTNENGYFSIKLLTFSPYEDESSREYKVILDRKDMYFSKPGYKDYVLKNVLIVPGKKIMRISLERGQGSVLSEYNHGIVDRKPDEYLIKDGLNSGENGIYQREKLEKIKNDNTINETDVIPLPFFDPPSSIRVGTNCSCTSCSSVSVMGLEYYVGTGLDDEWIASWNAHSLRAGALAYRAYGSWHVLNPISSNYDICSTTCCQVWNSDQYSSTVNAGIYTSGFAISPSPNLVARAEYSAENNGLVGSLSCVNSCPCGNGYAGSPCTGWPCISDNVCSGQECFGHGRGMCQWGTYRWGNNGKFWDWMAIHYYSPKNWHISTPMGFTNLSADPTNVQPGQTFTIYASIYSGAEHSHNQIMLGASLYDGVNWISDPPHDVKINVIPETGTYQRQFTVPNNIEAKCYDLVVMIWFDIDENNQINLPTDLPIDRITNTNYICITAVKQNEISFGDLKFYIKGSKLIFIGYGKVSLYSTDGKLVISDEIKGKKEFNLKKGVYILKSGKTIKVILIA